MLRSATETKTDRMSKKKIITLALESNETKGSSWKGYLYIRLDEKTKKAEVEILWEEQSMISYYKNETITIQYDDEKSVAIKSTNSKNDTSSFLDNPKAVIKKLMKSDKLTATAKLNGNSEITRTFDLYGLREALEPYREQFRL